MQEIQIYDSKSKLKSTMIGGIIFFAFGIAMVLTGEEGDAMVGWISIVLFGGIALGCIIQLIYPEPQLILKENGICYAAVSKEFYPWELINNAYLKRNSDQEYICLTFFNVQTEKMDEKELKKQEGAINITVNFLAVETEELFAFILAMLQANGDARVATFKQFEQKLKSNKS